MKAPSAAGTRTAFARFKQTMNHARPPHWRLPPGVTRGMWEYAQNAAVADDYDSYFAYNELFRFDQELLHRYLEQGDWRGQMVADLGCGTGRALLPLVRRGFRGLAIDLSENMLGIVRDKAAAENLPIDCVQANMVELDCLADDSVDHAICMFSTLGMIRGADNRRQALAHIRRIVRPGGRFVLHVHNFWFNLYDPGGPWWVLGSMLRAVFLRDMEMGDKFFDYRGVPKMFLHVFTRRELTLALSEAGFRIEDITHLDAIRNRVLPAAWLLGDLRANGWICHCV